MDLELPDVLDTDGWDGKKIFDFEHAQVIVSRAVGANVDLTNALGSEWTTLGFVFSLFGDKGRKLFMEVSTLGGAKDVEAGEKWKWCVAKNKLKSISKLLSIAKALDVDTTIPNVEDSNPQIFIPRDADATASSDYEEYGFFSKGNQYWQLVKSGEFAWKPKPFSNFTMEILFHIDDAKRPRRLVRLTNCKGRIRTIDVETHRLSSDGKFKEFIEGMGNFLWEGSAVHLSKLKRKLYDQEKDCYQLDQLGYNSHDDFYAFCNGVIYADEWLPVDENGIVYIGDMSVYIPSGNKVYARQHSVFMAEKKFKFVPTTLTFETWTGLFYNAYGNPGIIALLYNLCCLFSDIIFKVMKGFPEVYFYGEGGSGKGSIIKSCQCLYGVPQTAITLTGKANTDKAKIRKFAQFVNAMMMLEEFSNSLAVDSIMMLRGLWDRNGYERSVLESKYGTENVPIHSGVGITGNDYPIDDPLLQRLLIIEMNANQFTDASRENWRKLTKHEDEGISGLILEIMKHRETVKSRFEIEFVDVCKDIDKHADLFGVNVTERMIKDLAALLTMVKVLDKRLTFPFSYDEALNYGCKALAKQNEKRGNAGEVQKFFDCMVWLVKNGKVMEQREFELRDNDLYLQFSEIHPDYMMAHAQIYRTNGLAKATMTDKLKGSEFFKEYRNSHRYLNGKNTSSFVFDNGRLAASGINLFAAVKAWEDSQKKFRKNGSASGETVGDVNVDAVLQGDKEAVLPF